MDGACAGVTTTGTSCPAGDVAGVANCGAAGESCCTSLEVPGGAYYRTYPDTSDENTSEGDPATVSGFRLDKYLVTVGRFRQFVIAWSNGTGYVPMAGTGKHDHLNGGSGLVSAGATSADGGFVYESGWDATDWDGTGDIDPVNGNLACGAFSTWTGTAGNQETLPIDCADWFEAYAFCIWDGGFLPSEAEWEYVAAGGSMQLAYPWGSTVPGNECPGPDCCPGGGCDFAIYDCWYPGGTDAGCTAVTNIAPVGTAPMGAALWGQLDMAGDMKEWILDWYATPYVSSCVNCAYLTTGTYRGFRGGSFYDGEEYLEPPTRDQNGPGTRDYGVGFRCARTP